MSEDHFRTFQKFKDALNSGEARAADPMPRRRVAGV